MKLIKDKLYRLTTPAQLSIYGNAIVKYVKIENIEYGTSPQYNLKQFIVILSDKVEYTGKVAYI